VIKQVLACREVPATPDNAQRWTRARLCRIAMNHLEAEASCIRQPLSLHAPDGAANGGSILHTQDDATGGDSSGNGDDGSGGDPSLGYGGGSPAEFSADFGDGTAQNDNPGLNYAMGTGSGAEPATQSDGWGLTTTESERATYAADGIQTFNQIAALGDGLSADQGNFGNAPSVAECASCGVLGTIQGGVLVADGLNVTTAPIVDASKAPIVDMSKVANSPARGETVSIVVGGFFAAGTYTRATLYDGAVVESFSPALTSEPISADLQYAKVFQVAGRGNVESILQGWSKVATVDVGVGHAEVQWNDNGVVVLLGVGGGTSTLVPSGSIGVSYGWITREPSKPADAGKSGAPQPSASSPPR
jgi:hypothetical protein